MTLLITVLKRLALSKSTYKLIGLLLVTFGLAGGSTFMSWVSTLVCIGAGGCGD